MASKKSTNLFLLMLPNETLNQIFNQLVNNVSSLLLCKKNVLEIFQVANFLSTFVTSRSTKILIQSNFCLRMYVRYLLNQPK